MAQLHIFIHGYDPKLIYILNRFLVNVAVLFANVSQHEVPSSCNTTVYLSLSLGFCACLFLIEKLMNCQRRLACGRQHGGNFNDIKSRKKRGKNRNINRGKKLFHIYIINIGSYQCMNMCINVPC